MWSIVAAVSVGLAVVWWRPGPGVRLRPPPPGRPPTGGAGAARRRRVLTSGAIGASALGLVGGLGWWGVPVAAAIGAGSYVALGGLDDAAGARRRAEVVARLPQACDLLAVCLESGLPLRRSVEVIAEALGGPLAELLGEVAATVRLGAEEAQAWTELGATEPALAALGREVARTVGSGMALSRSLRSLGMEARRAAASAAEVRARRVGVRSVLPLMLCFLPAFLLLGVVPIIGGVVQHLLP